MTTQPAPILPRIAHLVLVVEDNPITRKMIRITVETAGYGVLDAPDGRTALELVASHAPDLIIQDLLLPDMDGFELVRRLRACPAARRVPIIACSGFHSKLEAARALSADFTDFIGKPIEPSRLLQTIQAHLRHPRDETPPRGERGSWLPQPHSQRISRQIERQAAMNTILIHGAALQTAQVAVLAGVSEVLARTLEIEQVLDDVLARFLDATGTSVGAIYLREPDGNLPPRAQIGYPSATEEALAEFFGHASLLRLVLETGEPISIPSSRIPPEQARDLLGRTGVESMLIVPLISGDERLGAMVMASGNRELGEEWAAFAKAVGFQISQAIVLSRTVARLADSEQRFRNLVHNLDAIVWEADAVTWRFSFVSRRAEDILGYPTSQWLEEPSFWADHIHPDDRAQAVAFCRKAVAEGREHDFEYRAIAADGRVVWLRDIVHVVADSQNQPRLLHGLMVDITEHKRLEVQLRQSQKMEAIGRLAGGVAHDFNNMLTAITGYCDLLLGDLELMQTSRGDVAEIKKAADRAAALTHQLLAFSRRQILAPQVLDLNTVVSDTEKLLRRLIGEDIDLVTIRGRGLGRVRADLGQIEQVIMNLAVNARDAMPGGGKLIIETANIDLDEVYASQHIAVRPGPYVLLAVSDTGNGIDAETQSRIFEPFFTTKEQGKGTGLGLSTVYGIVKQSGGSIWVYSEPGCGTTFKIYLPRVEEPARPARAQHEQARPPVGSETILLVEDEEAVRALTRKILQRNGYTVLEAHHGAEAIEIAGQHQGQIDLLVTDVVMPMLSGPQVAQQLLEARPALRVLYISGYTDTAAVRHGLLEPNAAFLQKPFTSDELARKVRALLDAAAPRQ